MRKDASLHPQTLVKALQNLGYRRALTRAPVTHLSSEWRRRNFHVILIPRKTKITVNLHVDVTTITSHHGRGRQHGKDIEEEFERIKQEYKRLRSLQEYKIIS